MVACNGVTIVLTSIHQAKCFKPAFKPKSILSKMAKKKKKTNKPFLTVLVSLHTFLILTSYITKVNFILLLIFPNYKIQKPHTSRLLFEAVWVIRWGKEEEKEEEVRIEIYEGV